MTDAWKNPGTCDVCREHVEHRVYLDEEASAQLGFNACRMQICEPCVFRSETEVAAPILEDERERCMRLIELMPLRFAMLLPERMCFETCRTAALETAAAMLSELAKLIHNGTEMSQQRAGAAAQALPEVSLLSDEEFAEIERRIRGTEECCVGSLPDGSDQMPSHPCMRLPSELVRKLLTEAQSARRLARGR